MNSKFFLEMRYGKRGEWDKSTEETKEGPNHCPPPLTIPHLLPLSHPIYFNFSSLKVIVYFLQMKPEERLKEKKTPIFFLMCCNLRVQ